MPQKIVGGESGLRKTALLKKTCRKRQAEKNPGKVLEYLRILRYIGKQERAVDRLSGRAGTEQKVQEKETVCQNRNFWIQIGRASCRERV